MVKHDTCNISKPKYSVPREIIRGGGLVSRSQGPLNHELVTRECRRSPSISLRDYNRFYSFYFIIPDSN